jgi:beta-phosphoglucomutase-like phosphatase (HAD superfamily)
MKQLKKKCLIFDHDDTLINSQETIHYPIFLETLQVLRPNEPQLSFKNFVLYSNQYGFLGFLKEMYDFTSDEIELEIKWWREKVMQKEAQVFKDVALFIEDYVAAGGILVVYSYSESFMIEKDYKRIFGFLPHEIIGFDVAPYQRKPARLPILQIMADYQFTAKDCLIVDDMPLLINTAKRSNIDMVGACWSLGAYWQWSTIDADVPLCKNANCLASYVFKD